MVDQERASDASGDEIVETRAESHVAPIQPTAAQPGVMAMQQNVLFPADAQTRLLEQLGPKGAARLVEHQHEINMRQVAYAEQQLTADTELRKAELADKQHRRTLQSGEREKANARAHQTRLLAGSALAAVMFFSLYRFGPETWKLVGNFLAMAVAAFGGTAYGKYKVLQQQNEKTKDDDDTR